MILGMLIRRWQIIEKGLPDPVDVTAGHEHLDPSKTTLRLVYVLEQALGGAMRETAVEWILRRSIIIHSL